MWFLLLNKFRVMITNPSFVRRNIFEAVFSVCLFEINAGTCSFKARLAFHEVKKKLVIHERYHARA